MGYLLKDFPSEELIKALRTVHHGGGVLIPPAVAAKVVGELRRGSHAAAGGVPSEAPIEPLTQPE